MLNSYGFALTGQQGIGYTPVQNNAFPIDQNVYSRIIVEAQKKIRETKLVSPSIEFKMKNGIYNKDMHDAIEELIRESQPLGLAPIVINPWVPIPPPTIILNHPNIRHAPPVQPSNVSKFTKAMYDKIVEIKDRYDANKKNIFDISTVDPHFTLPGIKRKIIADWQQAVYSRLVRNLDTFVSVPPAAGKTGPFLASFAMKFLTAIKNGVPKHSKQFPRIIVVTPTKQLALQIAYQDFLKDVDVGVYTIFMRMAGSDTKLTHTEIQALNLRVKEFISVQMETFKPKSLESPEYFYCPIVVGTYDKIAEMIRSGKYTDYYQMVVIDEFQESVPKPGPDAVVNADSQKKYMSYGSIMRGINPPGKCGLALLTGSLNQVSICKALKFIDSEFKRDFNSDKIDDCSAIDRNTLPPSIVIKYGVQDNAYNRSIVKFIALDDMRTPQQREQLVKNIIRADQKNSVMVLFSVKRSAKGGIFRLISDVIDSLPKKDPESLKADLGIPNARLRYNENQKTYGNQQTQKRPGDVNDLIDRDVSGRTTLYGNTEKRVERQDNTGLSVGDELKVDDIEFLKYFDIDSVEKSNSSKGDDRGGSISLAVPDENNLLYRAVLAGIGVLIGPMGQRYKIIIQKLFRSGKITLLLGTDALGVGANIKCAHLYIPTLNKISEGGFGPIDSSSLVQLVNRAGRTSDIKLAKVYVSPSDAERAIELFSNDPALGVEEIDVSNLEKYTSTLSSKSPISQLFT